MKAVIEFVVDIPYPVESKDFKEWIRFNLGRTGTMNGDNILTEYSLFDFIKELEIYVNNN